MSINSTSLPCYPVSLPAPFTENIKNIYITDKCTGNNTAFNLKYKYVRTNFFNDLNPELQSVFNNLSIQPDVLIILGHINNIEYSNTNHLIHTDAMYHPQTNELTSVPFAINYELTDTKAKIFWWDTGGAVGEKYSLDTTLLEHDWYRYGSGIAYGGLHKRYVNPEQEPGYKLIHTYDTIKNQAFLFNTTIPHSSNYEAGCLNRICVTLRFPIAQIPTWSFGVNLFKEYLLYA